MNEKEKVRCETMRDRLADLTEWNNHTEAAYQTARFFANLYAEKGFDGLNPFLVLCDAILEIWREWERKKGLTPLLSSARCGLSETVAGLAREVFPAQAEIVLQGL